MSFEIDGRAVATGGPEDRLLPWRRVEDMTGISRTTAWRLQKAGEFPDPVPISAQRVGWWESELTAWKARRQRERLPPVVSPDRSDRRSETKASKPAPDPVVREVVAPAAPPLETRMRRPGRKRPVCPGQIDFGF